MRAFVFTDKSLASQARRFVWLDLDTEKAVNAPLRQKFAAFALPTFVVVDPDSEKAILRWVGGATVAQLDKMLSDASLAVAGGPGASGKRRIAAESGSKDPAKAAAAARASEALARADLLYGRAQYADAAKAYQDVLSQAPSGWSRYARTVESLLFSLQQTEAYEQGARLSREAFPRLRRTSSAANVAGSGLDCVLDLPADSASRAELLAALEANARQVVDDASLPVAPDDRSGVYGSLVSARKDAKDAAGARELASRWAEFLEDVAARAKNPEQRAAFDSHRLSVYLELGRPERAIPMLQASERDLPDDYNPAARMATAYKAMKRWDDALAASDRALAKAYGPRKLGILQTRAEIYIGRGDSSTARSTLEEALHQAEALPVGQRSESTIANLKKKIGAIATR